MLHKEASGSFEDGNHHHHEKEGNVVATGLSSIVANHHYYYYCAADATPPAPLSRSGIMMDGDGDDDIAVSLPSLPSPSKSRSKHTLHQRRRRPPVTTVLLARRGLQCLVGVGVVLTALTVVRQCVQNKHQIWDSDIKASSPDNFLFLHQQSRFRNSRHAALPVTRIDGPNTALTDQLRYFAQAKRHVEVLTDAASHGNVSKTQAREGREQVLEILESAGVRTDQLSPQKILSLPTWQDIADIYGDEVVVVSRKCELYRRTVPPNKVYAAAAGMFNTGTNLLLFHLRNNVQHPKSRFHFRFQVPWGKHRLAAVKWEHTVNSTIASQSNKEYALPVVIIRDPFQFFQSLCTHPYAAHFRHGKHHCPILVPNEQDLKIFRRMNNPVRLSIRFDRNGTFTWFDSMADLWSDWYRQYLAVDYPIIFIRYEDLMLRPKPVMEKIAKCMGAHVTQPFQYLLESSKPHGSGTDLYKALQKTGSATMRIRNMTQQDLDYARERLDEELMQLFHYRVPEHAAVVA